MIVTSLDPVRIADAVWVEDGRVATPGRGVKVDGELVVPGNVCAHTHLYSALARGMPYRLPPPENFLQILQRIWWRLDRALDEETIRASALVGGMEALLSGTTTVVDHHASPNTIEGSLEVIHDALASLGVRHVLCYEVSDRDGPERASEGIEENRGFLDRVRRERPPLARALVGAHASFTLSDETLAACAELGPLHVHAAEDRVDYGAVARLARLGVLHEDTLLAHGVHLDPAELDLVGKAGATLAHNARSNMNNAVGRLPAFPPRVALGTDGIGADMFEESRTAFFRLREEHGAAPDWPLSRLAESARLAGRLFDEPLLGTLEPGAPADLVVLDYPAPAPLDAESFPGHWVFGLSSRHVRHVMVRGEWAVWDRRLCRIDQTGLARAARPQAARLWQRIEEIPAHDFAPKGGDDGPRRAVPAGQASHPGRDALRTAR
ncbi:MAG: amidohydrolase family protein [Verrucomicrobiota bacterium]